MKVDSNVSAPTKFVQVGTNGTLTAGLENALDFHCFFFSTSQEHSTIGIRPSLIRLRLAEKSFSLDPERSTVIDWR